MARGPQAFAPATRSGRRLGCAARPPANLLVLDEFTYVYNDGMATPGLCEELLLSVGGEVELVITGRNPGPRRPRRLPHRNNAVRHPFTRGVTARRGIEF